MLIARNSGSFYVYVDMWRNVLKSVDFLELQAVSVNMVMFLF